MWSWVNKLKQQSYELIKNDIWLYAVEKVFQAEK